jgi:hydroxymethylpyrimidine pyrophosphatase-like HAD family hydrolase
MIRHFQLDESTRLKNQKKLKQIEHEVLTQVPGSALASDQFTRLFDLAIDFCEDVPPLKNEAIEKIVRIFESHGAKAKVSSIHVNGWFGDYDKRTMCESFYLKEYGSPLSDDKDQCAFIGDSPNDEPLFEFFENSFAVANLKEMASQLKQPPTYITNAPYGKGFVEFANHLLNLF